MIKKIIFTAEPFCFGPISSSITVTKQLKKIALGVKCIFVGQGTAYQLATKSNIFDECVFETNLDSFFDTYIHQQSTLVVANTHPDAVVSAIKNGLKTVFIDTLFWMWDKPVINFNDVERYYAEHFHCANAKLNRLGDYSNILHVAPLVDVSSTFQPMSATTSAPLLLVALGGVHAADVPFPIFYKRLIRFLFHEQALSHYRILVCGGGEHLHSDEFKEYSSKRFRIACLSPEEYKTELKNAYKVLASPGVHGFYELYYLQKEVCFLPPQNYSQHLQLTYISQLFEEISCLTFDNLNVQHGIIAGQPEIDGIKAVIKANEFMINEEPIMQKAFHKILTFLAQTSRCDWSNSADITIQPSDGPEKIAHDLLSLITSFSEMESIYDCEYHR